MESIKLTTKKYSFFFMVVIMMVTSRLIGGKWTFLIIQESKQINSLSIKKGGAFDQTILLGEVSCLSKLLSMDQDRPFMNIFHKRDS